MTNDNCACRADIGGMVFCPLHEAAGELLAAISHLKYAGQTYEVSKGFYKGIVEVTFTAEQWGRLQLAVAKAEGIAPPFETAPITKAEGGSK